MLEVKVNGFSSCNGWLVSYKWLRCQIHLFGGFATNYKGMRECVDEEVKLVITNRKPSKDYSYQYQAKVCLL